MPTSDSKNNLFDQIERTFNHANWSDSHKNKAMFELFTLILEEATHDERLNFTTLFSRLAFTGIKFQLSKTMLHYCHVYRKGNEKGQITNSNQSLYLQLGAYICAALLYRIWKVGDASLWKIDANVDTYFDSGRKNKTIGFKQVVEGVLYEIDVEKKRLLFYDEDEPTSEKIGLYDIHDKNEMFNQNIDSLSKSFDLPIHINLIDVEIREDETYVFQALIIQPDHLVDVTAIAECFKDYGTEPFSHLISRFKPVESTASLLIGNLVNLMLDELISDPQLNFKSLLSKMFQSNPLGFAVMDDQQVKDLIDKLKNHFRNLQFVVLQEFKSFNISRQNIFLEPSFYSRDYGIQGRLDLLHQRDDNMSFDIIELKSGATFKPNIYGINAGHYIQTLLYDLMIKSTYSTKAKLFNYILYSKESEKPLRYAPPVRTQQYEAMKLRNDILAMEQKLKKADEDNAILKYIKPSNFPKMKGFNANDIQNFNNIYTTLNEVERDYLDHYCAFIAREQSYAKTGQHGINKSNGVAALWLENEEEKKERFALLDGLKIIDNMSEEDDAIIIFSRNTMDDNLVNFRLGDIGVLYPVSSKMERSVLKNQIFKCTFIDITTEILTVKLRNKQYNQNLFKADLTWNIEQDSLDSSFNSMYKNLFSWAAAPFEFREMILGIRKPNFKTTPLVEFPKEVTISQANILNHILAAKDYFLLWGPPGTGKTSVMLKHLVKHLHENTRENLLLLAYTNRAVDEICDAVMAISDEYRDKFLRLGSRIGTSPHYNQNLLDQVIKKATSRQEIVDLLAQKRIFISTISSVVNRTDLFQLKDFDTVIIDEASQVLEPLLVGLLSKFRRFVLIGDHKQLPAVVTQDGYQSKIEKESLNNIGMWDCRTSLFERLYLRVKQQNWNEAYGVLEQQGRMNKALMTFPNLHFYENRLQLLPDLPRLQKDHFFDKLNENTGFLQKRIHYISTQEDEDFNWKTNKYEAKEVVSMILQLIEIYDVNQMEITSESIGVITPYRAQIALIKQAMKDLPSAIFDLITVDTVERYQGGARDIIIMSFCVNRLSQLDALISPSHEGIDRKLNVAITRAREHLILIGNRDLLSENDVYKALLDC